MSIARRPLAALLLTSSLLLVVGCGSSDSEGAKDDPTTTEAPSAGDTTTAAEGGGEAGAAEVNIVDFAYDPDGLEVAAGSTVTFTNSDSAAHTATSTEDDPGEFDTGELAEGDTADVTLDLPGDYKYICSIHDYMTATITVTE